MEDGPLQLDREEISRLLSFCNDPAGVITKPFGDKLFDLAQRIETERKDQAVQPYTVNDMRFLLHSAVLTATAHFGQTRDAGGESVWESHLLGTDKNLITELGRTRVPVLAAGLGHDLKEDTDIRTVDRFRDAWQSTFRDSSDLLLQSSQPTLRRTWDLISGATKVKQKTRLETSAHYTRTLLGFIRELGFDIVHLKAGGDRLDNMRTVAAAKPGPVAQAIADETYEVYCRMGDIIGIQRYVRTCVDLCAGVLNPKLLKDFDKLRDERMREGLDMRRFLSKSDQHTLSVREYIDALFDPKSARSPAEREILESIVRTPDIKDAPYVSAKLSDFTLSHDEPLQNLQLKDLDVSTLAPLFEILILVKPGTNIHDIITYLIHHCAEPGDRRKTEEANHGQPPNRGTRLTIYSRKLGILVFRINDTVTEARSKRGALPLRSLEPAAVDPISDEMKAAIRRILRETQGRNVVKTIPLTRELLLRPSIVVFTPRGDSKTLPKGSTAIDFAAAVHPDLAHGFEGVLHHISEARSRLIDPFEPLEDGMQLEILHGEKFTPDPGWLLFCETELARAALRKFLNRDSLGASNTERCGEAYVKKIAALFGLSESHVMSTLLKHAAKTEIPFEPITTGKLEPVNLLCETYCKEKKVWRLRAELPDEPGVLRAFLAEFDRQDINVNRFLHIPRSAPAPHIIRMEIEDKTGKKSHFEIMKILMKMSYEYRVALLPHDLLQRTRQRISDFWRIVRNTLGAVHSS